MEKREKRDRGGNPQKPPCLRWGVKRREFFFEENIVSWDGPDERFVNDVMILRRSNEQTFFEETQTLGAHNQCVKSPKSTNRPDSLHVSFLRL